MPNIAYFEVHADDVARAKNFYKALLGWEIAPTKTPMVPEIVKLMQYHDVVTGKPEMGTLSMGGIVKRQMPGGTILNYVLVEEIDKTLVNVEKLGGKVLVPKMEIPSVGLTAVVLDTEGNAIGIWKPE